MLKISKLDAAKRQLESAIIMYFRHGDPVSIHTLAAAAYNVVRDVNSNLEGNPLFVKDRVLEYAVEGKEQEVRNLLNKAENFFKHADRDHDEVLDFNPEFSEMFILDACSTYNQLTGEFPPLFKLFQTWIVANNPELFDFPEEIKEIVHSDREVVTRMGREGYFSNLLPMVTRAGT